MCMYIVYVHVYSELNILPKQLMLSGQDFIWNQANLFGETSFEREPLWEIASLSEWLRKDTFRHWR